MKIVASSDWHVDAVTASHERLEELEDYVTALEAHLVANPVDLVVHLGDLWDPGTLHDARWATFVYRSFTRLSWLTRFGMIALPGNHDVIDQDSPLSTLTPLRVAQNPANDVDRGHVLVVERPYCLDFEDVTFLVLPYVSRAYERSDAYAHVYKEAMQQAATRGHNALVVLTHLSFDGMHPGSETLDMPRGREISFPVAEVRDLEPAAVLAGHYHKSERIVRQGLEVHIVGSPVRFTFGEDPSPRGFLQVEV